MDGSNTTVASEQPKKSSSERLYSRGGILIPNKILYPRFWPKPYCISLSFPDSPSAGEQEMGELRPKAAVRDLQRQFRQNLDIAKRSSLSTCKHLLEKGIFSPKPLGFHGGLVSLQKVDDEFVVWLLCSTCPVLVAAQHAEKKHKHPKQDGMFETCPLLPLTWFWVSMCGVEPKHITVETGGTWSLPQVSCPKLNLFKTW